jgi:stage V sporulation protein R
MKIRSIQPYSIHSGPGKLKNYMHVSSSEIEEEVTHKIGRGIHGQSSYPLTSKTTPELSHWNGLIYKAAREEGLDPFDVNFWVMKRDALLGTAARGGFPVTYRHWTFGQSYQEMLLPQKHGFANLYELVINNDPSYAYLLEENPMYAQKLVMAHVHGHSDFFKNNYMFSGTFRKMLNRMADHAGSIKRILDEKSVAFEEMEKFIDKYHSIRWLIDMTATTPRDLDFSSRLRKEPEKLPENWGMVDVSHLPPHMQSRFNEPERIEKERKEEEEERERRLQKIPPHPDRDVLAFVVENSKLLNPWQRHVLTLLREESYYFAPQKQTKIMNEGWASFWHMKLMKQKEINEPEHTVEIGNMIGRVFALQRFQINPYTLGYEIFKDIEERWNKGQHGSKWEEITDMEEKKKYDDKSMKGKEKIFEVRKSYNDIEFIRTFFTPEIATKLKMYTWDPDFNDEEMREGDLIFISGKEFEKIRQRLLDELENGGEPIIEVMDGNFRDNGELLLHHVHSYDLKQDYAEETLKSIKDLWGAPVHLDTYKSTAKIDDVEWGDIPPPFPDIKKTKKRMRISIVEKDTVKRHILKDNGEIDYECDAQGNPLQKPRSPW